MTSSFSREKGSDVATEVWTRIGAEVAAMIERGATLETSAMSMRCSTTSRRGTTRCPRRRSFRRISAARAKCRIGSEGGEHRDRQCGLWSFLDDNKVVELRPCDRSSEMQFILGHHEVVVIDSDGGIDQGGQVHADALERRTNLDIGGQLDFILAAPR